MSSLASSAIQMEEQELAWNFPGKLGQILLPTGASNASALVTQGQFCSQRVTTKVPTLRPECATLSFMERQSLGTILDDFLRHGDETAYVERRGYRTVRWSYGQVAVMAFQFARELESRGIGKGQRILLWDRNSAEWVAAFFGCALRGVVVVPLDDNTTLDFALRICKQVDAKLLVGSREHAQLPIPALTLETLQDAVVTHSSSPYPATNVGRADPLQIVFTSGTTAEPKGVVISHENVLANISPLETEIHKYLKYERLVHPVRFLSMLPLSHVFGQFLGMFLPEILAGTVVFQDKLNPSDIIATLRRERVSVLVAVPHVLRSLKEKLERDLEEQGQLSAFRRNFQAAQGRHFLRRWWTFRAVRRQLGWKFWAFICGGAALDSDVEEFWARLGYAVVQGYGLTETTSLISVNHPFHLGKGSIGKVLAGREIKLADDGEILVRGGGVAAGYWTAQNSQPAAAAEGWYHTGDLGELDADGNLYFKGRKKEVIVTSAGMNVYPEDLEAALRRQSEVKDCVVVGLPRDGNADPCAVLILRDPAQHAETVVQRANELLAEYQRMHAWFVWPENDFPRTPTQKPRRGLILQTVQDKSPAGSPRISKSLEQLLAQVSGRPAFDLSGRASLEGDLNLSSLDRVALLGALEDRYQTDLNETAFSAVNTVGDLDALLRGKPLLRVRYHYPRWAQRWPVTWVRLLTNYLLVRPAVLLLGWPRVEGREKLRGVKGPLLVVCNHLSDVDPGFVMTALPARFGNKLATATGGEALQALRIPPGSRNFLQRAYDRTKWALGVALLNLFPLPRAAGFRESFAYAGESADRGYSILVFPEGRHTTDGKLLPFRAGIGLLATNLGLPIVPMRIDGLFELIQSGRRFARPGELRVRIGDPLRFPPDLPPEEIARQLQEKVASLGRRE